MLAIIILCLSILRILHADSQKHQFYFNHPLYYTILYTLLSKSIVYFSMAQENINPSTINLRSKGVIISTGKIHKGCVKDATTKLSIGSIPSTYESIIYKTDCKKAFGTSEKRFYEKENASMMQGVTTNDDISTVESYQSQGKCNHNRLGQNAFVSKQKREWFRTVRTPGPTHYYNSNGTTSDQKPKSRKCWTRQSSKKQRISPKEDQFQQSITPGPGQYIRERKQLWQTTSKGWKSSFETKVDRDGYIPQSISPGPGYYEMLAKAKTKVKKQSNQKEETSNEKNIVNQILKQKNANIPGPCSYNQQIPTFKPLYQRIKMSKNFMAPVFTGKRKGRGIPGPTAYPVKRIYQDIPLKLIESTCFMSQTIRDPFCIKDSVQPTSSINPKILGHKNFHFNIKNQWM